MLYLTDEDIRNIGMDWGQLVDVIEQTVRTMDRGDYHQPLKPYLRYGEPRNRIIAMPAYIGGSDAAAGLKWIASFPGNLEIGLPRAHSVTVLNNPATGKPEAILNATLPSAIRTAAVSGLMLRHYLKARGGASPLRLGIIGYGPVGRLHHEMCQQLYGDQMEQISLYDVRGVELDKHTASLSGTPAIMAGSWQQVYASSNVVITCTVSSERYINRPPAAGSMLLHVSLRDYEVAALDGLRAIVVDDWTEVCREGTDIEQLHLQRGLVQSDTRSLADVVCREALAAWDESDPVLFCPMGMASFDIAIARFYTGAARQQGIGLNL